MAARAFAVRALNAPRLASTTGMGRAFMAAMAASGRCATETLMNRIALLTLALAAAATSAVAVAQQAAPAQGARHGLDANHDGAIDRVEAAKLPGLAAHFDQLDKNHDGRLDAGERPHMRGGRHGGHRFGGIARLDRNGDGRIGRDEVADGGRFAGKLTAQFAAIDTNHDGYLVRSETEAWHARMKPQRMAERARRFDERFAAADLNRDGKLSKVEVGEKMPRMQEGFAWMDGNRDGFLSREELRPKHR
jgi:Ca2+-binding EF-hand superfamily protein